MILSDLSRDGTYPEAVVAKKTRWGGKRKGAGRPSEVDDPVRFTFDIERAELDSLKTIAGDRDQSVAKVMRDAVRLYLRRKGAK